jgi:tetratricopeptide (TPR) repeat protein
MNKASNVDRNLDFHSNPEVNYPFIAEAQFVSAQNIAKARQVFDNLIADMQQTVSQSQEQTMLGKLNAAILKFYEYRPDLTRYAMPTINHLFTEQLLGNGPGQDWFALHIMLFSLKAKMQTADTAWADLNLLFLPGEILLEYHGEYYTNEFDAAMDLNLVQTRTSRPNDGFSTFLKIKDKADILNEFEIPIQNAKQFLRPLQEHQIEFLHNMLLAIEMDAKGNNQQFKEYLLKAYEVYPCAAAASYLLDLAEKKEDDKEIIHYASDILERFGWTTGEIAREAYHDRAVSYLALQDYENAEKDILAVLNFAQDSNDAEKIYDIYDELVHVACKLNNMEKIEQYATALLNLGVNDSTRNMQLHITLGMVCYTKKDWATAKEYLLSAYKIAKQLNYPQEHPALADINSYLMHSVINGKIYDDALLEIAVENLDSVNSFPFHWYIGQFSFEQQNYTEARKQFTLTLNQLTATGQFDSAAIMCLWLARIAAKQGDYPEVLRKAQEGLKLNNNLAHAWYLHSALAYLVLGQTKNAEKTFTSALELFRQNGSFDSNDEGNLWTAKEFLLKQGRQDDAAKINDWLAQLKQTKP